MKKFVLNIHETMSTDQQITVETNSEDELDKMLDIIENGRCKPTCFDDYLFELQERKIKVCDTMTADPDVEEVECDDISEVKDNDADE